MCPTRFALLAIAAMVSSRILGVAAASAAVFSVPAVFAAKSASSESLGPSAFTAPGAFPTSLYKHYYNSPTATSAQPQPVISDPVTVSTFGPVLLSFFILTLRLTPARNVPVRPHQPSHDS